MVQKHPSRGAFLQPLRRLAACLQAGTQTGEAHRQDGWLISACVHELPSVQELVSPPTSLIQRRPGAEPVSQLQTLSTMQSKPQTLSKHELTSFLSSFCASGSASHEGFKFASPASSSLKHQPNTNIAPTPVCGVSCLWCYLCVVFPVSGATCLCCYLSAVFSVASVSCLQY